MIELDENTRLEDQITDYLPDWFKDQFVADTAPEKLAHDFAYHMIWQMKQPKKMETVIKHLLAQWRFLALLAKQDNDLFLEVFTALVERSLDNPRTAAPCINPKENRNGF